LWGHKPLFCKHIPAFISKVFRFKCQMNFSTSDKFFCMGTVYEDIELINADDLAMVRKTNWIKKK
jgi:hypothetical protein